jgi:hypothetical protein
VAWITIHATFFIPNHTIQANVNPKNEFETIDIVGSNKLLLIGKKEVDVTQAYCMKCRTKREMKDAKAVTMKNGKPATQGVCPTCGTKMFRIGKS